MSSLDEYFKCLSDRERAIFEGAISMGALFHQFTGTPVNQDTLESLKAAIESSIRLQPSIEDVKVEIHLDYDENEFGYVSLEGRMLDVKITSRFKNVKAIIRMKYIDELKYPLIYVESVKEE
ncbi:MAG TPA: dihydroneopterin aldolase [Methanothermobacter sp.]|uniref:Dihydroneopterin aldolase n=1 Tax=Methanothermobacter tenebrarum TaxID=680118 RepID=A0ABN6P9W3_9EURY|nr:dihydroneopterin aldolase family protein [Methanothermobacter tenebrarum]MDI6881985.1 dihydroneopterin aldolase family protein [Methanothermobacter sp.]BDH79012.1 dihydroneopterin aldolase [Methanothermobacter tenebrarum]HHW16911.1 dihydroneopterin aldolase [Methanothermobacter sp.]HOQ20346.1 dihydroneopterin aldolase family protein [Methanothermobacter sp.]